MDSGLLVPYQDVLDLLLLEDFVVDVEDGAAGIPEDVCDAFFLKTRTTISAPVSCHCC